MKNKTAPLRVRVDDPTKAALQAIADGEHLDLSDIVRRALFRFIEAEKISKALPHGADARIAAAKAEGLSSAGAEAVESLHVAAVSKVRGDRKRGAAATTANKAPRSGDAPARKGA